MKALSRMLWPGVGAWSPPGVANEGAWTSAGSIGSVSQSGLYVGPERALQASAVWSCVRLIAESIATMPIIMYRRLPDGGKERATWHPLYSILHDSPNELQTAFDFKRVLMVHALLYGNGYALIGDGPRGAVDHLTPLYPESVRVERIEGGIRYQVRGANGREQPVNAEDILHLPGLSLDGISGMSLVTVARESIGLALAAEGYSARFYSQNARPGGVLKTEKKLSPEGAERLRTSWQAAHAGLGNAHSVAVLEEGTEWQQTGMTNQDAELIAQLDWSAADIARFFNVPLHMIQLMTKSTSWGSGIEEMGIEFVTFTLLPWIRNWEQLIQKRLVLAPQQYFAEFLVDSLMRGKLTERYEAYATGRNWGWLSVDDIRTKENMNPLPDGLGQRYLEPLNMQPAGATPMAETAETEEAEARASDAPAGGHYALLLREAAARVVRKEIAAMTRVGHRHAEDHEAFTEAVGAFYQEHAAFVAQVMHIAPGQAEAYCASQRDDLLADGPEAMTEWEPRAVDRLVTLAKGATQ